ncbi:MAG TPA: dihydroxyacetone kinase subunit DhaL [Bryobacteraceae bacterium]|nr:dihydroxyacetone kinase subunit DhaL [Bryobacteraceae bacterium]
MKKLINAPANVVADMLQGFVALYPGLSLLSEQKVLFRSDIEAVRDIQVALVSGGGSGHEPAHGGYVGAGMLSAAVAGEVFTSPSPDSVLAAIRQVAGAPGVLLIIKNYTGDRLNFGLAAEMARSQGISVEAVTVADDIALAGSTEHAGARGLAGTVLIHKIAGAAAAAGQILRDVTLAARSAADDLATIGLSLSAGTVPAVGRPSYFLTDDEVELGLGIHGEPGVRRMALQSANDLAEQMLEKIVSAMELRSGTRVALLVNNLGATTAMELAIFGGHAVRVLQSRGMQIERVYSGPFVTSLDAAGVSLSILRVDDSRLALLDAPASAPGWPIAAREPVGDINKRVVMTPRRTEHRQARQRDTNPALRHVIQAVCEALITAEPRLTELDQASGDGDLGLNLARGAQAVQAALDGYPLHDPSAALQAIAGEFQQVVGGSSGPFYGVMLLRASQSLLRATNRDAKSCQDAKCWARAALDACEAISELGGALPGDRTMIDALMPFATEFNSAIQQEIACADALESAVNAAEAGAEATASMTPRRGRASYLGKRAIGSPDPGAVAVSIWLRAIQQSLARSS